MESVVREVPMLETPPSLLEFFHTELTAASRARAEPLEPEAEHYVVHLLVRVAEREGEPPLHVPLVEQLGDALEEPRDALRFLRFRTMGDSALVRRGLFPEALLARGLRDDYVEGLGRAAYAEAARVAPRALQRAGVFDALADSFASIARLLVELRERVRADPPDPVRLALVAHTTGSAEASRRLASLGLLFRPGDGTTN